MSENQGHEPASALAQQLGHFTEDDLQRLAGVKASTLEAWRKRGTGPAYVLFGRHYLYPRAAVSKHLENLVRERPEAPAKGQL